MAKLALSEMIRLRNYFTLVDNKIVCDICPASFVICVDYENVKTHIYYQHNGVNVSAEDSQEDGDLKFHTIQNNSIKCTLCNKTYTSMNTGYIIKTHLEGEHGITNNIAVEICELLYHYYKSDECNKNVKQCNECKIMISNKSSFLINHLNQAHEIIIHSKIGLRKSSNLLSSEENVKDIATSSRDQQPGYSKSSDIQVRDVDYDRDSRIKHLKRKSSSLLSSDENIKDIATSSRDPQAGYSKSSDIEVRDVDYDRDSRMKRLKRLLSISEHLLSSFKAAEVIATSSMHQQPTQNFDQISGSYNIYNQIAESTENRSTRYAVNNATSSSYQQPTQNFYQFSGSYNICDQIDEFTENRLAKYAENNATSSSYQQPTQNSDQISDSDNLYDLIDEYTENELIRYAENNVTSSNYQPPTQNIDQISDSADLFDVIAELTGNRLPR